MKVVILGAAGQVGRAVARSAPPGTDLLALDRAACDISDRDIVAEAIAAAHPALIFNAAAHTAVDRAQAEPERAALLNAHAPGWIAAAAARAGARMVHVSTDYVFSGSSSRPWRPDDQTAPRSVYGRTKRDGELAVLAAAPDALVVRTAWVYAAAGRNFLGTMMRAMRQGDALRVVDDQIGTPTYAAGLAAALWRLAERGEGGIVHYTDSGVASWYDFALAIGEEAVALDLLPAAPEVIPVATADSPAAAPRPPFSVLDKRATWAALGAPAPHWRANLRTCLREVRARA